MAWTIFGVQNFEIQYFFFFFWGGGGQKNEYFWGYEKIAEFFLRGEGSSHY